MPNAEAEKREAAFSSRRLGNDVKKASRPFLRALRELIQGTIPHTAHAFA
jgi:hypothetical protein